MEPSMGRAFGATSKRHAVRFGLTHTIFCHSILPDVLEKLEIAPE
jgi:hypothetical protein